MKQIGILAILFTVLLAAVITKEISRPDAGALRDQVALVPLGPSAFAPDDVLAMEISGPAINGPAIKDAAAEPGDASTFTVRRDGERWLVDGAFTAPAAAGVVMQFLDAAASARGELRLEDAAKLAKFDLSPERTTTVTLRGAGGALLAKFAVGRSSGTQGAFVRLLHDGANDDAAYVVAKDLRSGLGLGRTSTGESAPATPRAAHFHDLGLPPIAVEGATRVDLVSPLWSLAFEKAGAEWAPVIDAPQDLATKPSGIRGLVQQLGGSLGASALVDPARRAELGLEDAAYRVQITLADGSTRAAEGAADHATQKFYLRLVSEQQPDVVYEATRYAWERLFPPGSILFDFKSLDVADEGLTRLEIEGSDAPITMSRETGRAQDDWTLESPAWGLVTKQSQLRNLTAVLRGVRPVDFVLDDVPFEPEMFVSWGRVGDLTLRALQIGGASPTGAGRLAVFPETPDRIFVIADSTVERVVPKALDLFERRPMHGVLEEDVTALAIRAPGGDDVLRVTRGEGGAWALSGGDSDGRADALAVSAWIGRLLDVEIMDVADGPVVATREIVIEREAKAPLVIGVDAGEGRARISIGDTGFDAEAEDLLPDPATLTQ